ncbi:MAG: 1-acyl-sn-glycerol-3-phosphate acyltransferase [Bacteroidales bacterium]|nr:1-acyl-sn-glycerol-3-phosphate acyltransferase [Bacteroidales bacterium]
MKEIWEHRFWYSFFRPWVEYAAKCHYSNHLEVVGRDLIPDGSVVFAINHQNGLMDALTVLCTAQQPVVFLCRGDIFSTRAARWAFAFLRALPVYRPRDGRQALAANEATFDACHQALLHNVPVYIAPEGTHHAGPDLLPFKKGFAQMACRAQAADESRSVSVVPVGIAYSSFSAPWTRAEVQIGQPIDVSQFMPLYHTDPIAAYNAMSQQLRANLTKAIPTRPATAPRLWLIIVVALALIALGIACPKTLIILLTANPLAFIPTTWLSRRLTDDPQSVQTVDFGLRLALILIYIIVHTVWLAIAGRWATAVVSLAIAIILPWAMGYFVKKRHVKH